MTVLCVQARAWLRPLQWLSAAALIAAFSAPAWATETVDVAVDQARLIRLPQAASTVVIGNPLIADLSIQPSGVAVITGKGYGATNIIVLDSAGTVLMEANLEVKGPTDPTVVVHRGFTTQTYSCTPECSRRITLGDTGMDYFDEKTTVDKDYFAKTLEQSNARNTAALGAGADSGSTTVTTQQANQGAGRNAAPTSTNEYPH